MTDASDRRKEKPKNPQVTENTRLSSPLTPSTQLGLSSTLAWQYPHVYRGQGHVSYPVPAEQSLATAAANAEGVTAGSTSRSLAQGADADTSSPPLEGFAQCV